MAADEYGLGGGKAGGLKVKHGRDHRRGFTSSNSPRPAGVFFGDGTGATLLPGYFGAISRPPFL
jgi:hypothetical protein